MATEPEKLATSVVVPFQFHPVSDGDCSFERCVGRIDVRRISIPPPRPTGIATMPATDLVPCFYTFQFHPVLNGDCSQTLVRFKPLTAYISIPPRVERGLQQRSKQKGHQGFLSFLLFQISQTISLSQNVRDLRKYPYRYCVLRLSRAFPSLQCRIRQLALS